MLGKESIGPAIVIETAAAPSATMTVAEDTAQTHPNPAIQYNKRIGACRKY